MKEKQKAVVALGMFDGVHMGHRALVLKTVELAEKTGAIPAVYTFVNHPMEVLKGQVRLLSTPEERLEALRALGAEDVFMDTFTLELAALSPQAFIRRLQTRWNLVGTVCGFNYTFGDKGAATPATLGQLGAQEGFFAEVVPPVLYEGQAVSSTRVRTALEEGDVVLANKLLTRPYTLSGPVIANKGIGRSIGFPTANIQVATGRVLPGEGVYATLAAFEDKEYPAVTNIGTNPTVNGKSTTVETHLIGYTGALYGTTLTVYFVERLRGEIRFSSLDELRSQIARDVLNATELTKKCEY